MRRDDDERLRRPVRQDDVSLDGIGHRHGFRGPWKGEAAPGPASLTRGAARRVASGAAAPTSCHSAEEDCRSEPTNEELLLCRLQLLPPLSRLLPPLCLL